MQKSGGAAFVMCSDASCFSRQGRLQLGVIGQKHNIAINHNLEISARLGGISGGSCRGSQGQQGTLRSDSSTPVVQTEAWRGVIQPGRVGLRTTVRREQRTGTRIKPGWAGAFNVDDVLTRVSSKSNPQCGEICAVGAGGVLHRRHTTCPLMPVLNNLLSRAGSLQLDDGLAWGTIRTGRAIVPATDSAVPVTTDNLYLPDLPYRWE